MEFRVGFCEKMLRMHESFGKIQFFDESRLILGDDERWTWL
jgi:hypothetical protein